MLLFAICPSSFNYTKLALRHILFLYFAYYFNMLECTSTSRLVTGIFVCCSSAGFNNATSGTDIVDEFLVLDSFLSPKIKVYINSNII